MRKIEISSRVAACASALTLAGATLAACGGSSGAAHNGSPAARTGTAATSTSAASAGAGSATARASRALSAKTRAQLAERLRSLRSRAARPTQAPAFQATAFRTALTHFAGCLRQQGVNIPAPNASGRGPVLNTRGLNTHTPQYRAAVTKCRGVLVAAFRRAARARR